jgi:hypothetical protein
MNWLFEEEKEGLTGEPAKARVNLKLAALSWILYFLCWKSGFAVLKFFGLMFLLVAIATSARGLFHLVTVVIIRLPEKIQGAAQVLVALIGGTIPFVYFFPRESDLDSTIFAQAFEPYAQSPLFWLTTGLFVYIIYSLASRMTCSLEVRRYLVLAAAVSFLVLAEGHGGFDTDEEGYSSTTIERPAPQSIAGRTGMATNYLRLIILGYGALLYAHLRQRASRSMLFQDP